MLGLLFRVVRAPQRRFITGSCIRRHAMVEPCGLFL
jgi:hypothetical protein